MAVRCVFPSEQPDPMSVLIADSGDHVVQTDFVRNAGLQLFNSLSKI